MSLPSTQCGPKSLSQNHTRIIIVKFFLYDGELTKNVYYPFLFGRGRGRRIREHPLYRSLCVRNQRTYDTTLPEIREGRRTHGDEVLGQV